MLWRLVLDMSMASFQRLCLRHAEQQAGEPILLLVLLGVFALIFIGAFVFAIRVAKKGE